MNEDDGLYGLVQDRLARARIMLSDLDVSDDVRAAVERRLQEVEAGARFALTDASRRLERLVDDLESDRLPVGHDD